jgi:glycosyltransferase involved in cell wall biosynthesis
MMSIRVAIVAGQLGLGGSEQQLFYLLRSLPRDEFEPLVVSFGDGTEHWRGPIESLGIPVYGWGRKPRMSRIASLARLVANKRVHVVHGWEFFTGPYAAAAAAMGGARALGSLRQELPSDEPSALIRRIGRIGLEMLVANSGRVARSLRGTELEGLRCEVVRNGVESPEDTSENERARSRARLGLHADDLVLMTAGRLDADKNPLLLVEAFARLREEFRQGVLVFLGDGPLRLEVQERAAVLGAAESILLPGFSPGAAGLLAAADVVALTSGTEGMPNVLMEASAAGVPVVATDVGGVREVVEDGRTGFVVNPGDLHALIDRLGTLLRNGALRASMGKAGRAKMRAGFSVDRMVERLAGLYREVA